MLVNKQDKTFVTRSDKPNEDWIGDGKHYLVDDNSDLANKIMSVGKYYDFVLNDAGELIDINPDTGRQLERLKEQKIYELSAKCKETIIYDFISSNGNGYRLTIEDQLNLQGQKAALDDDTTIAEVNWITIDDRNVTHPRDEWLTVYTEAFQHKNDNIFKNKSLRDQVNAATTKTEVDAVTWQ